MHIPRRRALSIPCHLIATALSLLCQRLACLQQNECLSQIPFQTRRSSSSDLKWLAPHSPWEAWQSVTCPWSDVYGLLCSRLQAVPLLDTVPLFMQAHSCARQMGETSGSALTGRWRRKTKESRDDSRNGEEKGEFCLVSSFLCLLSARHSPSENHGWVRRGKWGVKRDGELQKQQQELVFLHSLRQQLKFMVYNLHPPASLCVPHMGEPEFRRRWRKLLKKVSLFPLNSRFYLFIFVPFD